MRPTLLLAWLLTACAGTPTDRPPPASVGVLFVGNSLTYTNDLPAYVEALVPTLNGAPLRTGAVATANASLEDHWSVGAVQDELASGAWDVVVLQQGPSSLPASREHLVEWATRLADAARANGVRPALLTVWPPESSDAVADAVIASYAAAAAAADAELYPAGVAWRAARAARTIDPYGPDRFHPSPAGTYLTALVVAGGLTGRSTAGLPALGDVFPQTARLLQRHADDALAARAGG